MRIALFSAKPYDIEYFNIENTHYSFELEYFETKLNSKTASLCKGFDAVCAFVSDDLCADVIAQLANSQVKYIALRSAGFNHVDLSACKQYSIPVVRVPAYSPHAVAEHSMALLLSLNRKIHKAYLRVRESNFALNGLMGFDLHKKTVGIIGLGQIGQCFANICLGFGMSVLACDPAPDHAFIQEKRIKLVSLETLLSQSDVISLHCPLNDRTKHIINYDNLASVKNGCILINTGRGSLINSDALLLGLKKQRFAAVGLDVYEHENAIFFEDHSSDIIQDDTLMRLTTFPNVLITSHQAFFTEEALSAIAQCTLANLNELKQSLICQNTVSI